MNRIEELFEQYNPHLNKVSAVFAYKSHKTIETQEIYQECAVKLIELYSRYSDRSDQEFSKILGYSLHSLGCQMLRERFNFYHWEFCSDNKMLPKHIDRSFITQATTDITMDVAVPSFLYFYKETILKLLRNSVTREVFIWLVNNSDVVDRIGEENNLIIYRRRREVIRDIRDAVAKQFELGNQQTMRHLTRIKNSLKQVWEVEYGMA